MSVKLDLKDRKILYHLDLDSRATLNQLARKAGLSKQVLAYRLKNLVKTGVIKQFYTVINFSRLGYTHYKLYLKFQNVNPEKEKEIVEYWISSKNIAWVASCRGRWDLTVSILARNVNEFGDTLNNFVSQHGSFVLEKDVLITQNSSVFTRKYLLEEEKKEEFVYSGKIEKHEPDEKDRRILSILSENARIPVLDLMKKTGLTRDVINYRIKRLKKDGIISQYRVLIGLDKISYRLYKIILRLHSLTPEKEKELISYVSLNPHGTQFLKLVGSWDCELEFEVKSDDQLHDILLEIRNRFSDIIRDFDVLLIHKEHKLNYFPLGD